MYRGEIEYTEPMTDSLKIRVGVDYKWEKKASDWQEGFDTASQGYTVANDLLTNLMSTTKTLTPKFGFGIDRKI
jgi:hypothetical protein